MVFSLVWHFIRGPRKMDDEKNKNVSRRLKPTCPRNVFLARIRNLKRQIDNEFASINRAAIGE